MALVGVLYESGQRQISIADPVQGIGETPRRRAPPVQGDVLKEPAFRVLGLRGFRGLRS